MSRRCPPGILACRLLSRQAGHGSFDMRQSHAPQCNGGRSGVKAGDGPYLRRIGRRVGQCLRVEGTCKCQSSLFILVGSGGFCGSPRSCLARAPAESGLHQQVARGSVSRAWSQDGGPSASRRAGAHKEGAGLGLGSGRFCRAVAVPQAGAHFPFRLSQRARSVRAGPSENRAGESRGRLPMVAAVSRRGENPTAEPVACRFTGNDPRACATLEVFQSRAPLQAPPACQAADSVLFSGFERLRGRMTKFFGN